MEYRELIVGARIPVIGIGTWKIKGSRRRRQNVRQTEYTCNKEARAAKHEVIKASKTSTIERRIKKSANYTTFIWMDN